MQNTHLNLNFRYTVNHVLVCLCPVQYLGYTSSKTIICCLPEVHIYLVILYFICTVWKPWLVRPGPHTDKTAVSGCLAFSGMR